MSTKDVMTDLLNQLEGSLSVTDGHVEVIDPYKLQHKIHILAEISAFDTLIRQGMARYLTRLSALALGIYPASTHDLYIARGNGDIPANFTVPAMNLRAMSFDAARAVFRAAIPLNAGLVIFEIARSEMNYTQQPPSEYATNILAAAIAEGYRGPVFIQGDHFQVSAKRFTSDPETELQALRDLIKEAINAGFYNIDIDTSTLVDLNKATISEQQALNSEISATLTAYIRSLQPEGVTISVGGEIGEVGGKNSTEPELEAYLDSYLDNLQTISPGAPGLSKISIQTGTSHGGVVLPDGSIQEVSVDFETLFHLSRVARQSYKLAGTVQHGASTLPEDAFGKFVECEACEVHLATNFQNMLFERLPGNLRADMYAYLNEKHASERKPDMTDEQFYYKTRKFSIGPFKKRCWDLESKQKQAISLAWEEQFHKLFTLLNVKYTSQYIQATMQPVLIFPQIKHYLGEVANEGDVIGLAD